VDGRVAPPRLSALCSVRAVSLNPNYSERLTWYVPRADVGGAVTAVVPGLCVAVPRRRRSRVTLHHEVKVHCTAEVSAHHKSPASDH